MANHLETWEGRINLPLGFEWIQCEKEFSNLVAKMSKLILENNRGILGKDVIEKAKEKICKTPKHPNNDCPRDSEKLSGDLNGWYSQRISKKDRLVYKKDADNKIVYIATVCGHYDKAPNRIKSTDAYRRIED